jgi:DNA uptake protein ComE-like DNA-binding protein
MNSRHIFVLCCWLTVAFLFVMAALLGRSLIVYQYYASVTTPATIHTAAQKTPDEQEMETSEVVVQVMGAVHQPGVYHLKPHARAIDAVLAAHGPTIDANLDAINLAAALVDATRVRIPTQQETSHIFWSGAEGEDRGPEDLWFQSQQPIVHVSGAVQRPGVYMLAIGAHNIDALLAAQGATKDADLNAVNLAAKVTDGMHLRIPNHKQSEAGRLQTIALRATDVVIDASKNADIVVHLAGAVRRPGVYHFKPGARNQDAVNIAGLGATPDANLDGVNLAALLYDGAQIYVPTHQEYPLGGAPPGAYVRNVNDQVVKPSDRKVIVHVAGGVKHPGLYVLKGQPRYDDALRVAGGVSSSADLENINLALPVDDGSQIYIPTRRER